jgi:tetratricopeptide (TPR) repeat protein
MPKPALLLLPLLLLASCAAAAPDPAPLERGGVSLVEAGRHTEAESLLQAALASTERRLGSGHRDVAVALGNLARLYEAEGRHAEATPLLRRAVAIREAGFGPDHPELAESLAELARSYADQGRYGEAVEAIRRAAKVRRVSVVTEGALRAGGTGAAAPPLGRDAVSARYVSVGWRLAEREPGRRSAMLDETFRAGQQVQARDVAAAVARVAARTAAGGDAALAPLVRDWLALVERRRGLDRALVEAAGRETPARIWERRLGERLQTLASLRRELAGTIAHLNALNARLAKSFPEYRELTSPVPAGVAEVQGLLAPDEALLAYAVLETGEGGAEEVFLWVVRVDRAEMYRLDLAPGELADGVRVLRDQLDPGRWAGDCASQVRRGPGPQAPREAAAGRCDPARGRPAPARRP